MLVPSGIGYKLIIGGYVPDVGIATSGNFKVLFNTSKLFKVLNNF